jgi:hypothetical protein
VRKSGAASPLPWVQQKWLKTEVEIDDEPDRVTRIAQMDDSSNMEDLSAIGRLAAANQVTAEHFPACFDSR